ARPPARWAPASTGRGRLLARRTRLDAQVSLALQGASSDGEVAHWDCPRRRSHGWSRRARVREGFMTEAPALQGALTGQADTSSIVLPRHRVRAPRNTVAQAMISAQCCTAALRLGSIGCSGHLYFRRANGGRSSNLPAQLGGGLGVDKHNVQQDG